MAQGLTTGITVIKKEQRGLVPSDLQHRLEERVRHHAEDVLELIRDYPAATSPNYDRTGDLGRAWKIVRVEERGAIRYRIINDVRNPRTGKPYAVYVQGKWQTAAAAHYGWLRIQDYRDRGQLARLIQQEIKAALGGGL